MASQEPVTENAQPDTVESESPSKPQDSIKRSKRITGTVKWFNAKDGFGFITRHDTGEDIFVHKSCIFKPNRNHFTKSIGDGEIVEFGLIASKVTGPGFKPVKGSPFVAKRGGHRSRPSSRASQISKESVGKLDTVGDGAQRVERLTKKLSIHSVSDGTESENAQKQVHFEECGDASSNETGSTNNTSNASED